MILLIDYKGILKFATLYINIHHEHMYLSSDFSERT
jgi:hypothetical protein